MRFWVVEQRDTYSRAENRTCAYDPLQPFNLADCPTICPVCQRICCPRAWLPPFRALLTNSNCGDLILGTPFEWLVSEKFKAVYYGSKLTGIDNFQPVDHLEIKKEAHSSLSLHYFVARPRISFTVLDEAASGVIWEEPLPSCNKCRLGSRASIKRVVVNESSWDASDVFMATGFYGRKLVSERFVDAIEAAKLTNFVLVPAEEYTELAGN